MKSAYELAMERLGGGDDNPLNDEQKRRISDIDARYKAKIAERRIFLEKSLSDAQSQGKVEEIETIRRQLSDEILELEAKSQSEKDKIREN